MSGECITKREVERLLGPEVLTYNNGRITYKNRDITFSNGENKIFNINSTSSKEPNEIVQQRVNVIFSNANEILIYPDYAECNITVVLWGKQKVDLEVFKYTSISPIKIIKNSDGSITTSGGTVEMRTIRWTYNYFKTPSIEAENSVIFDTISSETSNNSISAPYKENILVEDYYDNVKSYFNTSLSSRIYKDQSNGWIYVLPVLDVYYGDNPPYYTRINYMYEGKNHFTF